MSRCIGLHFPGWESACYLSLNRKRKQVSGFPPSRALPIALENEP